MRAPFQNEVNQKVFNALHPPIQHANLSDRSAYANQR